VSIAAIGVFVLSGNPSADANEIKENERVSAGADAVHVDGQPVVGGPEGLGQSSRES
jgi:hypothetical protein